MICCLLDGLAAVEHNPTYLSQHNPVEFACKYFKFSVNAFVKIKLFVHDLYEHYSGSIPTIFELSARKESSVLTKHICSRFLVSNKVSLESDIY